MNKIINRLRGAPLHSFKSGSEHIVIYKKGSLIGLGLLVFLGVISESLFKAFGEIETYSIILSGAYFAQKIFHSATVSIEETKHL
jgi:hypothetical protein